MIKLLIKALRFPYRFLIKLRFFKEKNLKNKFSIIYKNNYWDNGESLSGPGSTLNNTRNLRNKLNKIIKKYKIKSILDAPCGDCNWVKLILKKNKIKYIGVDIVEECINNNKKKFKNNNLKFKQMDITRMKLPNTDLFICRDFMFHLSYKDTFNFLKNIKNMKSKFILISNHSKSFEDSILNKNIKSGDFKKINFFKEPYNFSQNYEMIIKDDCDGVKKYLILFRNKEFKKFYKNMKI